MSSVWGNKIKISVFGGSHTEAIGVTIDGLPSGERIDMDKVLAQMARRAPGKDKAATKRNEGDIPEILSGFLDGITTGAPLCAVIRNTDQRSNDYSNLKILPRPGHSDYTAAVKYNAANDIRGGGHFSGRLTAPIVFAGSICRQILERRGIVIGAHAMKIGSVWDECFDAAAVTADELNSINSDYFSVISSASKQAMYAEVEKARLNLDSVGGIVECAAVGLPAGLGEPMFGGVESVIASIVYGIPAVKGVEFGAGFAVTDMTGSENNDEFYYDENTVVKTRTNNCGGILGGITNGMPLVFRAAFKPTASIGRQQNTVNLAEKRNDTLIVKGRHDPCIVPRAIPVVEAAAAIAIINLLQDS